MRKRILMVVALAAVVPLVLAVAGVGRNGKDKAAPPATRSVETGAAELQAGKAGEPALGAPEAATLPVDGAIVVSQPSSSLPAIGTRVVQTAFLRLALPKGRFEETVQRARAIAAGHGGFVASSTASKGLGERLVRGTLVVRVPEQAYAEVVGQLGRLGKVEGREESGQDVSAQFVDLEARARHLEAVEAQLLTLLERTSDVPSALAVQQQLNAVQLELEQVRGQLRYLDDQTSYATISLELYERGAVAGPKKGGDGWGVVQAWRDGARGFVRVTSDVFVAVATAAPILLILALALLAGRQVYVRRRARNGGLPAAEH